MYVVVVFEYCEVGFDYVVVDWVVCGGDGEVEYVVFFEDEFF